MTLVGDILATEARLIRWVGDIPSTEGGGGSGSSDRTGNTASRLAARPIVREGDPSPDAAWRDLDYIRRIRHRITQNTATTRDRQDAANIIHRWRDLTPEQEQRLRASAAEGDPGCRSCARIMGPSGLPLWSPCHPGLNICQWCSRTLARIRIRAGHVNDQLVHPPVLRWRQSNPDSRLTDERLDQLLNGRITT